jgi:release factor glutamine methyltransferase
MESIAAIDNAYLIKKADEEINETVLQKLNDALTQLLLHKPIQYVTGECWFYKMKLKVNEHVLIPRPETEELVELISSELSVQNQKDEIKLLDIGTGSGCIAIALISAAALTLAKENAANQKTEINFIQLNFLDEEQWNDLPMYDIIISNPPYIPINEKTKLDKNVTEFEPHTALFVPDNNPLLFYKKIAAFAKTHLKTGGKIFMEVHEDYAKETAALFFNNYSEVLIQKDISGKDRMLKVIY